MRMQKEDGTKRKSVFPIISGVAVELDELIAPAIIELNERGYITAACCSGHVGEPPYANVQFDFGVITPDTLPKGWYWDDCIQNMEYRYQSETDADMEQEIRQVMADLYDWSKSLPIVD